MPLTMSTVWFHTFWYLKEQFIKSIQSTFISMLYSNIINYLYSPPQLGTQFVKNWKISMLCKLTVEPNSATLCEEPKISMVVLFKTAVFGLCSPFHLVSNSPAVCVCMGWRQAARWCTWLVGYLTLRMGERLETREGINTKWDAYVPLYKCLHSDTKSAPLHSFPRTPLGIHRKQDDPTGDKPTQSCSRRVLIKDI